MSARVLSARAAVAAAAGALALAAAACFSERPTAATGDRPNADAGTCRLAVSSSVVGGVQAVVAIKDFRFVPDTLRVPRGTMVTWVNCEEARVDAPHTTTSDSRLWSSELMRPAATYSRRFDQAGAFPYHCEPHPTMTATVIVQ